MVDELEELPDAGDLQRQREAGVPYPSTVVMGSCAWPISSRQAKPNPTGRFGELILHETQDHLVVGARALVLLHAVEEASAVMRPLDCRPGAVVEVAFRDAHFAEDDLVAGSCVAHHLDLLDADGWPSGRRR